MCSRQYRSVSFDPATGDRSSLATDGPSVDALSDEEPSSPTAGRSHDRSSWSVFDVAIALALVVAAGVTRRHVLPHDGLFGDDAWQAFGAMHASPSNLLTAGFSAPGFTALLSVWHSFVHRPEALADVAFAAGLVSGAVTFVVLRGFGTSRSISVLVASALVAGRLNVIYSGRVKSYVIDALIVFGLAVVIPRMSRRTWNGRVTVVWVIGAVLIGLFSPFVLVAALVGGVVVLARPSDDLGYRVVGVGTQGFVYAVLTLAVRRTYNVSALQQWWQSTHDGFVVSHSGPFGLVSQSFVHLRRVAVVFSGGPSWWAVLVLVASVGALVLDARMRDRSAQTLRAQHLVLLLLVAFLGGLTKVLPFGPTSDGMRLSLWLVPIFAIGAARALTRFRDVLVRHQVATVIFDLAAIVVAVSVMAFAATDSPHYPQSGARSATDFIETHLTPTSVVFIENDNGVYPYGVATRLHVSVKAQHEKVAFVPQFNDPRIHYLGLSDPSVAMLLSTPSDRSHKHNIGGAIGNATDVSLYLIAPNNVMRRHTAALATLLHTLGFGAAQSVHFDNALLFTWHRAT